MTKKTEVRMEVRKPKGYDPFPRVTAQDRNLSPEAIGILTFISSHPRDWIWSKGYIKSCFIDCDDKPTMTPNKLNKVYRELKKYGYTTEQVLSGEGGKFKGKLITFHLVSQNRYKTETYVTSNGRVKTKYWSQTKEEYEDFIRKVDKGLIKENSEDLDEKYVENLENYVEHEQEVGELPMSDILEFGGEKPDSKANHRCQKSQGSVSTDVRNIRPSEKLDMLYINNGFKDIKDFERKKETKKEKSDLEAQADLPDVSEVTTSSVSVQNDVEQFASKSAIEADLGISKNFLTDGERKNLIRNYPDALKLVNTACSISGIQASVARGLHHKLVYDFCVDGFHSESIRIMTKIVSKGRPFPNLMGYMEAAFNGTRKQAESLPSELKKKIGYKERQIDSQALHEALNEHKSNPQRYVEQKNEVEVGKRAKVTDSKHKFFGEDLIVSRIDHPYAKVHLAIDEDAFATVNMRNLERVQD